MRFLALFCLLLLPMTAAAQDNPIIQRMQAFTQAYNAQDAGQIGTFYAADAILLAPGQKAIIGTDAIVAHYRAAFEAGARDLQFKTFDIRPLNDKAATEIGETVVQAGGQRIVGRYMHLWEIIDGNLVLTRDMYHVLKVGQ